MKTDDLGDRMKEYENLETSRRFMKHLPIYARIDGRSFSKFTKNMERPYDVYLSKAMIETTKILVENTHAIIGYTSSDEISLAWMPTGSGHSFFDGKIMKMTSVLAGIATAAFVRAILKEFGQEAGLSLIEKMPHFDARVISLPSRIETANMLLWRNLDATKNAISMAASHYYSHNALHGKSGAEKQEMLFEKDVNFNDYPPFFKRGTWVKRTLVSATLDESERLSIPEQYRPEVDAQFIRSKLIEYDLPPLQKIANLVGVLFDGEEVVYRT